MHDQVLNESPLLKATEAPFFITDRLMQISVHFFIVKPVFEMFTIHTYGV